MSEPTLSPLTGIEGIRRSWGWFLALGILLIVLGMACIAFDVAATLTTVLLFGWMLLIGGVFALVQAFTVGTWSGFFLYLLSALFRGVTGYLLIRNPVLGAEALTLVLASFFVVSGLFRAIGFAMARFPRWGWAVFSGIVTALLGVMLLAQIPTAGIWFTGFAIGVDLVFDGVAICGFAIAIHQTLPGQAAFHAA
jgi:uncharacterized membrane protein HdeD (DUF308 family)